ncbi:acetyltransferase [Nostoc sp.]|uniref:acetyltransferase n=1 Tax=Nostoc sp. TaxID=1180 RepID=UPI002FF54887
MTKVLIAGAGGFGSEVYQYLLDVKRQKTVNLEILGFIDDFLFEQETSYLPVPILGKIEDYQPQPSEAVIVALGDPQARKKVSQLILDQGGKLYTLIHPNTVIADSAVIGEGCILCPFTFVGANATLERGVLLNTYASAGHDSIVGAYSVLSPYGTLNGKVRTEEGVFLGTHSSVNPGISVGRWSKISAGCAVSSNVPEGSLVANHPLHSRVMFKVL